MTLILSGTNGLSDVDGSAATPAIRGTDANTGIFFPAADTIAFSEGGTEAMRIDSSGNVGIGATSPKKRLTVSEASSASTTPGTNPVIWVGGGNVTANTLSEIGFIYGSNTTWSESNVPATVGFQLTSTAGFGKGALTFCTRDVTTDTAPTERMRIDTSGNLLVGTTTAGAGAGFPSKVAVDAGAGDVCIFKTSDSTNAIPVRAWNSGTTGNNVFVNFATEASYTSRGSITYNRAGGLIVYGTTSDYRAKDIIGPVINSGALIDSIPVYMGKMKWASEDRPMFIAHETPSYAHTGEKDAVDADGNPIYQQMDASALIPVMWAEIQSLRTRIAAIQEQQAVITQLQADVAALKAR